MSGVCLQPRFGISERSQSSRSYISKVACRAPGVSVALASDVGEVDRALGSRIGAHSSRLGRTRTVPVFRKLCVPAVATQ
jgi:hypothetical protein